MKYCAPRGLCEVGTLNKNALTALHPPGRYNTMDALKYPPSPSLAERDRV